MESYSDLVPFQSEIGNYPIKVTALGGLDEMGKNCYVIEVNEDAFIIEAGLKYPSANIPGVDIIIPDFDYIKNISHRVKAIIITHGHDDQYGALPFLLSNCRCPVYATDTTIQIISEQYEKSYKRFKEIDFIPVQPSETLVIAGHVFELFQTTHSVTESFGFALRTKLGNIVYTSDFITDYSPMNGYKFDLPKVARLSEEEKTFLLMTESEAADKEGIASPNHKITEKIRDRIEEPTGKTFISIYSQNLYNIQEVINLAKKYKKKLVIANADQIPLIERLKKINSLQIPDDMIIPSTNLRITANKDVIILVSGSGEKLFSLIKEICYGNVPNLKVETNDTWIDCAPSVPGTEVAYTDAADTVFRTDCHVLTLNRKETPSMHAHKEDLKMMISLFRPRYYFPVKGDFRLLMANAKLAIDLGVGLNHMNTFVYDNGMALAFDDNGRVIRKNIVVKNGDVLVDNNSVGDVKESTIEERQKMADGGVVLVGITVSSKKKEIISTPDIQMKGFMYLTDSEPIITQITSILTSNVNAALESEKAMNMEEIGKRCSDKIYKFIAKNTGKEPLVLVQVLDIDRLEVLDPR